MKNFNLVVGLLSLLAIGSFLAYLSQLPVYYPRNIIGYWPAVAGSLGFIGMIIFLMLLMRGSEDKEMPRGEFWTIVAITTAGVLIIVFVFLHSPQLPQ